MKRWWPLFLGIAVTPIVLLIGIISGGAGHGDYVLARILLPWASQLTGVWNFHPWHGTLVTIAAVAQCPLYGVLIAWHRGWKWPVLVAHMAMAIWLFTAGISNFA